MTDSTHDLHSRHLTQRRAETLSFGASLVAILIVAALVLTAIKLTDGQPEARSSLIPLDQPAAWSGFTA